MPHIHYKFSSKISSDTVIFDGLHITLKELKRRIKDREKLRSGDCDLQVTNAQTKEEYTDDEGQIPKSSSVIIRRIPIIGVKSSSNRKTRHIERSNAQFHHSFGAIKAMANLADVDVPEEDKINLLIKQSTYDSMNYNVKSGAGLPANYTCYRCGIPGHHIRNCPTIGDKNAEVPLRLKKSTGIPRSFMVEVDDPNIKGAMLTNCGRYAIPAINAKAYAESKKEKPPFAPPEQPASEDEDPVPDELICMICHELLSDAAVIPCCGNSFCDDCIRTALLDSDQHICPKCSQSDVSPDTLIANKCLRQAVNTFQKERGHSKSLKGRGGASQSQNPTWALSPVPTLPPLTVQSQPQKPHQSTQSQQAVEAPPLYQACGAPPTATCPAPASTVLSTSQQPVQGHQEASDKEPEEKTNDDSDAPSVLESPKHAAAPASQVTNTAAVEQPQTDSVTLQQSSDPAPRQNRLSSCWDSSVNSSSSGYATGSWSESDTPSSSSSFPATPSPLFPSLHFHTFTPAQQPVNTYLPGYPPAASTWTLQTPQRASIPPLCPSTTEWYMHQRRKNERSPHRGSTYRRSSSRSKSSKTKSSRSSSRSRSRSRSHSRSRLRSSYSRHRDLHTHSRSSYSYYSYGYKRSPTPSSSSSPRLDYRSRSKSPSDYRKRSHHSRHHSKKPASRRHSSRRRRESNQREAEAPEKSFDLYAQHEKQNNPNLDMVRYLQWKREYKDWCDKYFNRHVGHFHQLPPPLLDLPPTPLAQWGGHRRKQRLFIC